MQIVRVPNPEHNSVFASRERGQAVVEYLLVLMVGVVLVGLLSQIYKPFGQFLDSYYSSYLQCLLEAGELPGLPDGVCASEFQAATQGTLSTLGQNPVGGGSNSNSNSNSNRGGNSSSPTRNAAQNAESSSSDSSQATPQRSSDTRGGGAVGRNGRSQVVQTISRGQGEKAEEDVYTGSSATSSRSAAGGNGRRRRQPISGDFSYTDDSPAGGRQVVGAAARAKAEAGDGSDQLRPRKMKDTYKPSVAKEPELGEGFSFGFLFRIALIIIIIIAILLLVGSQLMQISKNLE